MGGSPIMSPYRSGRKARAILSASTAITLAVALGGLAPGSARAQSNLNVGSTDPGGQVYTIDSDATYSQINVAADANSQGTVAVTGATLTSDSAVLGHGSGSVGTITLDNSIWTNSGMLTVGMLGSGTVSLDNHSNLTTDDVALGTFGSGSGSVLIGGESTWSADTVTVGQSGSGSQLSILAGGRMDAAVLLIGGNAGSGGSGQVTVAGNGALLTAVQQLVVGNSGTGVLVIGNGGTVNAIGADSVSSQGTVTIAQNSGSVGSLVIGAAEGETPVSAGMLKAAAIEFGDGTGSIILNHSSTDYEMASSISGNGSLSVLSGTTRLSGANSYTGATDIRGGVLEILSQDNLGSGVISIGGGNSGSATLRFGADTAFSRDLYLSSNSAVLDTSSNDVTISGVIFGAPSVSLRKAGSGTLTLTGANTYQANTWLDEGTLVGGSGSFGAGFIQTADDTTLVLQETGTSTFANQIRGSGKLVKTGAGIIALSGQNGHTGGTEVAAGVLSTSVDGGFGAGPLAIDIGAAAVLNGDADMGRITVTNDGVLAIGGSATAAQAHVINNAGATVTMAGLTADGTEIGSLSGAGDVVLGSGTLTIGALNQDDDISGVIGGGGGLVKVGSGTLTLNGANMFDGGISVSAGTLAASGEVALGTGAVTLAAGTTLDHLASGTIGNAMVLDGDAALNTGSGIVVHQTGVISGSGGLEKTGAGDLHLNPTGAGNSYQGATTVSGGRLVLDGLNAVADQSAVTIASGATFVLSNTYVGGGETVGSIAGAGTVDLGGRALTAGANDQSTSFSGTIADNIGGGSFVKSGAGTLTLSGDQSYTGSTDVLGGTLLVGGAMASTSVNVASGATLGGTGTLAGDVTVNDGGHLAGQSGQTLSVGNLTLASGSVVDARLGAPSGTGLFNVDGDLRLNGATINVAASGSTVDAGVYRLIDYSGQLYNNAATTLGSLPSGISASDMAVQTAVNGQVNLVNARGLSLQFWDGDAAANLNNGQVDGGDGTWSATSQTWTDVDGLVTMPRRASDDMVIFQAAAGDVTIDGTVSAYNIQFATDGYTLNGGTLDIGSGSTIRVDDGTAGADALTATISSEISGNGGISKIGAGTLILTGDNSYQGATVIGDGTLIASTGSLGAGTIVTNTLLIVDQSSEGALSQAIDGGGHLTKRGNGTLTLSGSSSYYGGTTIEQGSVRVTATDAIGRGAVGVGGNAALIFDGTATAGALAITNAAKSDDGNGGLTRFNDNSSADSARITNETGATTEFWNDATAANALFTNNGQLSFYDDASAGNAGITNNATGDVNFLYDSSAGNAYITNSGGGIYFFDNASAGTSQITNTSGVIFFIGQSDAADARIANAADGTVSLRNLSADGAAIGSLSGAGLVSLGDRQLTVGGLNRNDVISGAISGDGGTLVKVGTGTLTLSGASSYTGDTSVDAGTLRVDGGITSDVAVASGASLTGGGTIAGTVNVAAGGHLAGRSGQTLTMNSLTLDADSVIDARIGVPTQTALFNVTGALTLDGTLNIQDDTGFAPGVTRLFNYADGQLTDNGLVIGTTPTGSSAADYDVQTAIAGQVNLVNAAGLTLNFWDGDARGNWNNGSIDGGSGTWSVASANWTDQNGLVTKSMQPQPGYAVFAGTAGTVTVDDSAGAVVTAGMQFQTDGYVIAGDAITLDTADTIIRVGDGTDDGAQIGATIDASLTGSGGIRKTDLGTLTLTGSNDYAGGTTVVGGTLVANSGSLGSGPVVDDARLVFQQDSDGTFSGTLTGSGELVKTGMSTLGLSGDGSGFGGTTQVEEGRLLLTGSLAGDVVVAADGTLQVGDGGTSGDLTGSTVNNGTLIFARSDDYDYTGALSGDGSLVKQGDGLLLLSGDYSYTGQTVVEAGSIRLAAALDPETDLVIDGGDFDLSDRSQEVNSLSGAGGTVLLGTTGVLTVNQDVNTEFAGSIAGSGTFNKDGTGSLNLTGTSSFTGTANVNGGRLAVNGTLPGNVVVNDGGTLGGNGTVASITANSGGIVAPGNSIGTLNVTGDVAFTPGSVYQVEVDAAGNSDRINATGAANITGGTVQVLAGVGDYAPFTRYTILTADGGVNGAFDGATSNYTFLAPVLSEDANAVYLELLRNDLSFAGVAQTPNQAAAAAGAEALGVGNGLYQTISTLDAAGARNAFDQLSGEIHASSRTVMIEDSRLPREAVLGRLSQGSEGSGAWLQGFGNWGSSDGDGNAARVDRDTKGLLLGFDAATGGGWRLGLAGGYTSTDVDIDARASNGKVKGAHVLGYAGGSFGALRVKLGVGWAHVDIDTSRSLSFGGFTDSLKAGYDGSLWQGFGELSWRVPVGGGAIEPFAALSVVRAHTEGFGEGGGAAALTGASRSDTIETSTLGLRMETAVQGNFSVRAKGGWQHAWGGIDPATDMAFAGGGDSFRISGAPLSRNTAVAQVEALWRFGPASSFAVGYDGRLGNRGHDHAAKATLSIGF